MPFSPKRIAGNVLWLRSDMGTTVNFPSINSPNAFESWTLSNATVPTTNNSDPVGGSTARFLRDTATGPGFHFVQGNVPGAAPGSANFSPYKGTLSLSVYVKANGRNFILLSDNVARTCYFNVTAGAGAVGTQTGVTGTIVDAGSGWYLCKITWAETGAWSGVPTVYLSTTATAGGETYTGDGVSGVFLYNMSISSTNGRISAWADQSGLGNNFTQATLANQPAWVASDSNLNGTPSLGPFNNTAGGISGLSYSGSTQYAGAHTVFFVTYQAAQTGSARYLWGAIAQSDVYSTNVSAFYRILSNAQDVQSGTAFAAGKHILRATFNVVGSPLSLADTKVTPDFSANVITSDSPAMLQANRSIGTYNADMSNTYNYDGSIAELIGYNRILNAAEISTISSYLAARYNQAIGP